MIWGYLIQQFDQTFYIIVAGFVLAAVVRRGDSKITLIFLL